jgi:pyridoxamine 5'-phosphate oxidase
MIEIVNHIENCDPYTKFYNFYDLAIKSNQNFIEAINISSFDIQREEVNSRFVNLKYINGSEWTFFSNYNSPKAKDFLDHSQISAVIFWDSINTQIRIKANIKKSNNNLSDKHFFSRSKEKNALAISSNQSLKIDSYDSVKKKYQNILKKEKFTKRPKFWGGYSFTPYYFEFWEGDASRVNKRNEYTNINDNWIHSILEP